MLKILIHGTAEYMEVTAISYTLNTLTSQSTMWELLIVKQSNFRYDADVLTGVSHIEGNMVDSLTFLTC